MTSGPGFDDEPPTRQIHVSELLAAHGRSSESTGGRRHRAVEDGPEDEPEDGPEDEPGATTAAPVTAEPGPAAVTIPEPQPVEPQPVEPQPVEQPATAPGTSEVGASHPGAVREWATVLAQLVGALAAGAALWFGFRALWTAVPVLAAVLATVVTLGLVVGVRVLRRDPDLVTAALALLAGLVVTSSPPLLALTGS